MSFARVLEKIGGRKSFQDTLLYFLTWFDYHYHFMSVDSSECAHFTRPRQNHKAGFMRPWCLPTLLSRVSLTLPPSKFHAPRANPCSLSKTLFNNFKVIFSAKRRPAWSTDPHSWITVWHLTAKDLPRETGPERVKLRRGESRLPEGVPLLSWACPPGSFTAPCAWLLFLSPQACLVGWLDCPALTSVALGRKPN